MFGKLEKMHQALTRFFSAHLLQGGPVFSSIMHLICIARYLAPNEVQSDTGKVCGQTITLCLRQLAHARILREIIGMC